MGTVAKIFSSGPLGDLQMNEQLRAYGHFAAPVVSIAAIVACIAPRHELLFAATCALVSLSCQLEYWLWSRYQHWPLVEGSL